jgi:hypothetical protein
VFRFTPTFGTRREAALYVDDQARAWLASHANASASSMARVHG